MWSKVKDRIQGEILRRIVGLCLAALVGVIGFSPASRQLHDLPDAIHLTEGHESQFYFHSPLRAVLDEENRSVLSSSDESIGGGSNVTLSGVVQGDASFKVKLLGLNVKTVNVTVQPERVIVPGGQSIGVAIRTQGVLVVGSSDIGTQPSPARLAGLRSGDMIEKVDGVPLESASHLTELLSAGDAVEMDVVRGEDALCLNLTPVKDSRDGVYRLGAWVRDSTAGVGTMSFYDQETGWFGALGHAITDIDTGTELSIGDGGIFGSRIIGIAKGESGQPGELIGEFAEDAKRVGDVTVNGQFGIYGETAEEPTNELYPDGLPIATRSEVRTGPAKILTTLDDTGIHAYDCEIIKLYHQDSPRQRSMVIKVTDPTLLEQTGGIVQGMSGSPIIQDERIVGAVTHVYVNDPTQGYGIYVEWMLEQCG